MEATLSGISGLFVKRDEPLVDTAPHSDELVQHAGEAAAFLKALGHEGRLMILCHLYTGERTVTELEKLLSSRQASVSQQLARLRMEKMVECRREGKTIYYSLGDNKAREAVSLLHNLFCSPDAK